MKAGVSLAGGLVLGRHDSTYPAQAPEPGDNPYSYVRGFNYQPSWSSSGHVLWRTFNRELFHKELAAGKRLFPAINTVRLWLSFDAFACGDAANQRMVASHFEAALSIADSVGFKVIPVLFNNWHSVPDFGGIAAEIVQYCMTTASS